MDGETVAVILAPVVTALLTGLSVALKQAWQGRDARQRARRQLREATAEVAFVRDWMAAAHAAGSAEDSAGMARARADLQSIYDQVVIDRQRARLAEEQHRHWTVARVWNAVVALRVRVSHPSGGSGAEPGWDRAVYRTPLGVARYARVAYWIVLVLATSMALVWFVVFPFSDEMGGFWVGLFTAALASVLVGVLPVAAVRAFVLFLDEQTVKAREKRDRLAESAAGHPLDGRGLHLPETATPDGWGVPEQGRATEVRPPPELEAELAAVPARDL